MSSKHFHTCSSKTSISPSRVSSSGQSSHERKSASTSDTQLSEQDEAEHVVRSVARECQQGSSDEEAAEAAARSTAIRMLSMCDRRGRASLPSAPAGQPARRPSGRLPLQLPSGAGFRVPRAGASARWTQQPGEAFRESQGVCLLCVLLRCTVSRTGQDDSY